MKLRFFRRNAMKLIKLRAKKSGKQEKPLSERRGPKHWATMGAMGALLALTPFNGGMAKSAHELGARPARISCYLQAQDQSPVRVFDIQPGTLDTALKAFQNVSGLQVQVPNEAIRYLSSPGVVGVYKAEEALKLLLTGTNVAYRFTAVNTATLELQAVTDLVEITGDSNALILSSPKFSEPLRDTPQSISVVSQQVIQDQGVTTLRDALRNVAGISIAAGEGGFQGDSLTVRGFTARSDLFIDNMRDFGSYYRDPFNLEKLEVLKGPSSIAVGRGSTGGAVNQETKFPRTRSFIAGTLDFGTDQTKRATLDINEPVPQLGKSAAFRLNLMGNYSNVAGRDIAENRRFGIAPSLALGLGSPTRFTISYLHQSANDIPDYGIPYLFDRPAPVPRDTYYGFKNANFLRTTVNIGTVKIEHDFNDSFTIRNQLRFTKYNREAQISEAQIIAPVTPTTPLNAIRVNRNQITVESDETFLQNQFDVVAKFQTGFVKYTMVAGIEGSRETSNPIRSTFNGVPTTTLLNPDTNQSFAGVSTPTSRIRAKGVTFGVYGIGTVKLGEKVEVVGGVRHDRFDVDFAQFIPRLTKFNRLDELTSYHGALVFKPIPAGSIYFSYATSFNPSAESLALTAGNANLSPEENRTYEIGSKLDILAGKMSLRGAIFETEKSNARETDPTDPLRVVLSGKQRVRGFEVEATGRPTKRMQLLASYSYIDSKLKESKFFPKAIGSQLANVPKNTFTYTSVYEMPWRLSVGASGQFIDSRTASSTVPRDPTTQRIKQAPSYFVLNLLAKRSINERIDIQVNVYNVTNKYYIDQIHPAHLVPGAGRSAKLSINFKLR